MSKEEASSQQEKVQDRVENESVNEDQDLVSYDSHRKLLDQHKRTKRRALELQQSQEELLSKLEQYEERDKDIERKKLEEKGEFDKIMQALKSENSALKQQIEKDKTERVNRLKRDAFMKGLPGPLHNDSYMSLANISDIAVDPETGEIDQLTVKEAVDSFVKEHPALIRVKKAEEAKDKSQEESSPVAKPVNLSHLDNTDSQLSALDKWKKLRLQEQGNK